MADEQKELEFADATRRAFIKRLALSARVRNFLLALDSLAEEHGMISGPQTFLDPSMREIAAEMGVSLRSAQYARAEAERTAVRYLSVEHTAGRSYLFGLRWSAIVEYSAESSGPRGTDTVRIAPPPKGRRLGVQDLAHGVQRKSQWGATCMGSPLQNLQGCNGANSPPHSSPLSRSPLKTMDPRSNTNHHHPNHCAQQNQNGENGWKGGGGFLKLPGKQGVKNMDEFEACFKWCLDEPETGVEDTQRDRVLFGAFLLAFNREVQASKGTAIEIKNPSALASWRLRRGRTFWTDLATRQDREKAQSILARLNCSTAQLSTLSRGTSV